jgi:hypothetical protein
MARIVRIHEYGDPSVLKIEDMDCHDADERQAAGIAGRRCSSCDRNGGRGPRDESDGDY